MRDDTAFMDRIHAYLPGWDIPKVNKELLTDHFGLVSDFVSECWSQLRKQSRINILQGRVFFGGALSGRDVNAVNKTVSGLLKLLYPGQGWISLKPISNGCTDRSGSGAGSRSNKNAWAAESEILTLVILWF